MQLAADEDLDFCLLVRPEMVDRAVAYDRLLRPLRRWCEQTLSEEPGVIWRMHERIIRPWNMPGQSMVETHWEPYAVFASEADMIAFVVRWL